MEVYQLLVLLNFTIIQMIPSGSSSFLTLTVRATDNIVMRCNISGQEEVAWYLLTSSDDFTSLISAEKAHTRKILPVHFNKDEKRFILESDSEVNTAIFTIINITHDDLGLYFCGTKPTFGDQMHFTKVNRLQFEDNKGEVMTTQSTHVENEAEARWCEIVLMFGGGVAAVLLLLLTVVLVYKVIRR